MVGQKRFDAKNVAQKTGRDGGNMCFWLYALVLAFSLAVAPMGQAQEATEEQAWIQIESYPSEATARARKTSPSPPVLNWWKTKAFWPRLRALSNGQCP